MSDFVLIRDTFGGFLSRMKTCSKCHQLKPLTDYYKHPDGKDGLFTYCRLCHNELTRISHQKKMATDPEWRERRLAQKRRGKQSATPYVPYTKKREPEKFKARLKVHYAVKSGELQREPCIVCGSKLTEGHHDDYSKPLEVMWLCKKHHAERHVLLRQIKEYGRPINIDL